MHLVKLGNPQHNNTNRMNTTSSYLEKAKFSSTLKYPITILHFNIRGIGFPSKTATEKIKYLNNIQEIYHPDLIILTETNNIHIPFKNKLNITKSSSNPNIKMGQGIAIIQNKKSTWKIQHFNEAYVGRKVDLILSQENSNFKINLSAVYLDAKKDARLNNSILNNTTFIPDIVIGDFNSPLSPKDSSNPGITNSSIPIIKGFINKFQLQDLAEIKNKDNHTFKSYNAVVRV